MSKAARAVLVRVVVVLAAAGLALVGPAPRALAHAALIDTTPEDGATLTAVPASVRLTFSDPIAAQYVHTEVIWPAGTSTGSAAVSGSTVTVTVPPHGPGVYRVLYRVVSADGHPVSGRLTFTVTAAATTSAGTSAAATTTPVPTSAVATTSVADPGTGGSGGGSWLIPAGIVVVIGAAAGALAVALRRRRIR